MSILVQGPDLGLSALLPENMLNPRSAAEGSKNIIYERGFMKTAHGFAKLDQTDTGMDGQVLHIFQFNEIDGFSHLVGVTNRKIYENDKNNSRWNQISPSALNWSANIDDPISFAITGHTDAITINDAGVINWYHHLIVCDGGNSNIQRWAGRYEADTADLGGGTGYHDGASHRAQQVDSYMNRLLLISPHYYSSSTGNWTVQSQRIQFPQVGKLQTWSGTGAGFVDLLDTGGTNVWSALLSGQQIIYQTNGIWTLRHVGGTAVFDPYPYIPDLGLLAPHLLVAKNNVHYFMGDDYNIYAYHGGSVFEPIGDSIRAFIEEDISKNFEHRCWMSLDEKEKRLWVLIVCEGENFISKAYGVDLRTGAWMVRDFRGLYDGLNAGVSAINLLGSSQIVVGETYNNVLDRVSLYDATSHSATDATEVADVTYRYGDSLRGDTTVNVVDWSTLAETADDFDFTHAEFSTGGLFFCYSSGADPTRWFCQTEACGTAWSGLILKIGCGSTATNTQYGSHYFTVGEVTSRDSGGTDWTIRVNLLPKDTTMVAWADSSSNIPVADADTSITLFDPSGHNYKHVASVILTNEALHIGDTSGFVYVFDEADTAYNSAYIDSEHITPTFDLQQPEIYKRWPGIRIVAKYE